MESILFLSNTEADGTLAKAALETLTAAMEFSKQAQAILVVGLFGSSVQPTTNAIASCGAQRYLAVEGVDFSQARYASDAAAGEALCRASGASIVFAPNTSRMSRV